MARPRQRERLHREKVGAYRSQRYASLTFDIEDRRIHQFQSEIHIPACRKMEAQNLLRL